MCTMLLYFAKLIKTHIFIALLYFSIGFSKKEILKVNVNQTENANVTSLTSLLSFVFTCGIWDEIWTLRMIHVHSQFVIFNSTRLYKFTSNSV